MVLPGIAASSGSAGPAPNYLALLDFVTGVYTVGGVSKTLSEVLGEDTNYGTWNPANVVPGVGIVATWANDSSPIFAGTLPATILAGVTFVVDFALGDDDTYLELDNMKLPEFTPFEQLVAYDGEASQFTDADGTQTLINAGLATGDHKLAYTITPAKMAVSIDGADVVTAIPATPSPAFTSSGFSTIINVPVLTNIIRSVTVYSPQDDAELPALSS